MTRKYNEIEGEIDVTPKGDSNYIKQIRTYKLITPLFGGGAEPQKPDAITTVRGPEVRGLLRFWWRAIRGGNLEFDGDVNKMKKREEEIWGSAAKEGKPGPSEVKMSVKVLNRGTDDRPFEVTRNKKNKLITKLREGSIVPAYAAFPLQPKKEDLKQAGQETAAVKVGVEFILEISYPGKWEDDVKAALWAWEVFGGLGGRTRRGFGALQLIESLTDGSKDGISLLDYGDPETSLRKKLSEYASSGNWCESVPHLDAGLRKMKIIKPISSSANQVWNDLIKQYQSFRQKRNKKLGISLWPEANELRRRLGRELNWPEEIKTPELVHKFPRAVFGLPILMHLPHDDPDLAFTLQGKSDSETDKKFERLASVLILKPIPCSNGKAIGLAAILDAPTIPPYGLEIKEPMDNQESIEWKLTKDDVKTNPLKLVVGNETDVIQAFLDFLK